MVGAAIDAIVTATAAAPAERVQAAGGDRVGVAGRHDQRDPRELRGDERAAVVIHPDAARVPPRSVSVRSGGCGGSLPASGVGVRLTRARFDRRCVVSCS